MDDSHIQQEINKYKKFKKVDGATYRKVNQFLRKRTYITAREWALARLCTDFRTSGGAEMTFIGKHLPELVPFMEDTYSPQAVNQARNSFKKKVRKASATFFYGAMCGFFTTDELDDLLFEASEVARFLLEVEGTTLDIDDEIDIEDRITKVMRGVGEAAKTILKARSEETGTPDTPEQVPAPNNEPVESHLHEPETNPDIEEITPPPTGIHRTPLLSDICTDTRTDNNITLVNEVQNTIIFPQTQPDTDPRNNLTENHSVAENQFEISPELPQVLPKKDNGENTS
jgi:hypothetical protein